MLTSWVKDKAENMLLLLFYFVFHDECNVLRCEENFDFKLSSGHFKNKKCFVVVPEKTDRRGQLQERDNNININMSQTQSVKESTKRQRRGQAK